MAKQMQMTNEEILKSYKEAKHRMKQVEILDRMTGGECVAEG